MTRVEAEIQPLTGIRAWVAILSVALCVMTIVTTSVMPVGVLTPLANSLDVTTGVAGLTVTFAGIFGAMGSLITPKLIGSRDRRMCFAVAVLLLGLSSLLTAMAMNFTFLAVARLVMGASGGVIWTLTPGLATSLALRTRISAATPAIFAGVSVGSAVGLPGLTQMGNTFGWRAPFVCLAVISFAGATLVLFTVPRIVPPAGGRSLALAKTLRIRGVRTAMVITVLGVVSHFTAFTYVRPLLEHHAEASAHTIVVALSLFGVSGVFGNFVLGATVQARTKATVLIVFAGIAASIAALAVFADILGLALVIVFIWGGLYGGTSIATQAWIRQLQPLHAESTAALWSAMFNSGVAGGALLGAIIIEWGDTRLVMVAGSLMASICVAIVAFADSPGARDGLAQSEASR